MGTIHSLHAAYLDNQLMCLEKTMRNNNATNNLVNVTCHVCGKEGIFRGEMKKGSKVTCIECLENRSNATLLVVYAFLVPLCAGICIAALIYNQYGHTMQAAEAISSAKYWIRQGAILGGVLGVCAVAYNYATKGVK